MLNPARLFVGAVAGAVLATTVGAAPSHAAAEDRGAHWLTQQLTDGLVHNDQYDFDDYGLTADVAFALDAVGGNAATVRTIRKALAPRVDSWTTGADFGSDDVYAGSVAKAAVLAQRTGADARDFGGVDLVKRLNGRVVKAGAGAGRIQDRGASDYANTLGQAFAAEALAVAGSRHATSALRFLLAQQCDPGYFRVTLDPADAAEQTCDAAPRSAAKPSVDATAVAVLSLQNLPRKSAKVRRAIGSALTWLAKREQRNGLYSSEGRRTGGDPNANSTGLAAWALGDGGRCGAAAPAAKAVGRLQLTGSYAGTPLEGERGAIAFDAAAKRAGADGISTEARDQWRRATAQAVPGLAYKAGCR